MVDSCFIQIHPSIISLLKENEVFINSTERNQSRRTEPVLSFQFQINLCLQSENISEFLTLFGVTVASGLPVQLPLKLIFNPEDVASGVD